MFSETELRRLLDARMEREKLTGVSACIMGPEGPVFSYENGVMNQSGRRVDGETMFGIASMSKSITALCLCILEAEGRLSLEEPVRTYIENFEMPGVPWECVRVRHLMNHTSGLPTTPCLEWASMLYSGRPVDADGRKLLEECPGPMRDLEDLLSYIRTCPYPLTGMPGEDMSYSNDGYAILSYIVDRCASMPLEDFMRERVFQPLGMTRSILDSGHEESRKLSGDNLTSLFDLSGDVLTCSDRWTVIPPYRGCAMVKSTARDMAVYYRCLSLHGMHEGRQAIPREAVERLIGAGHRLDGMPRMCFGLYKRKWDGHVVCHHAGGLYGVSSQGGLLMGEGYGFSVLCNLSEQDMEDWMWDMIRAVTGSRAEREWLRATGSLFSRPDLLEGRYTGHEGTGDVILVTGDHDRIRCEKNGERLDMRYCGGTWFRGEDGEGKLSCRLEFLLRDGRCRGLRCGSRIFMRAGDA